MGRERERNAFRNQNTSIDHLTPIDKADEYTFEKLDNSVEQFILKIIWIRLIDYMWQLIH